MFRFFSSCKALILAWPYNAQIVFTFESLEHHLDSLSCLVPLLAAPSYLQGCHFDLLLFPAREKKFIITTQIMKNLDFPEASWKFTRNLFLFSTDCLEIAQNACEKPTFTCSFFPLCRINKPPPAGSV